MTPFQRLTLLAGLISLGAAHADSVTLISSPNVVALPGAVAAQSPGLAASWAYTPDAPLTSIAMGSNGNTLLISGPKSYFTTTAAKPWSRNLARPDNIDRLTQNISSFGAYGKTCSYGYGTTFAKTSEGGKWIMAVEKLPGTASRYVAMYHHEADVCAGDTPTRNTWRKEVGIVYADLTPGSVNALRDVGMVITGQQAPVNDVQVQTGAGDSHMVVGADGHLYIFFAEKAGTRYALTVARSSVPLAQFSWGQKPTFNKIDSDGNFTQAGLGGTPSFLKAINTQNQAVPLAGANPHLHFNSHLGKWVMVYHEWASNSLAMATSTDLIHWAQQQTIAGTTSLWYPTVIGDTSSATAGQTAVLYAARPVGGVNLAESHGKRELVGINVRFNR